MAFAKKRPPEPVPSIFPILSAIARLEAGGATDKAIAPAVAAHMCTPGIIPAERCEAIFETGRAWIGWLDLGRDDMDAAARDFPPSATAWVNWAAGRRAFRDRKYAEAVSSYRRAVESWDQQSRNSNLPLLDRLAPAMNLSAAYAELGGAQLLAGDPTAAIATLNDAVRHDPSNPRALFLRGRARDSAGQHDAAQADYSLAARNALAKGEDRESGEAHVYRGISLYRRKDYTQAEDEFTNALNFEITPSMRADAVAWRRLAAVASGSCETGRKYLEEALPAASPWFPRDEARSAMDACGTVSALRASR
jgi:tetratricopeptide (TPR) repeat protein